ncbi:MAG: TIR domain-containing protein [Neisseriaceae bacterium]|nr:TIR domain-containing protein [Neisseriaceae bacterium]
MTYNLFISHSWSYSNQYQGLINLLDKKVEEDEKDNTIKESDKFKYKNYSVPKDDPVHSADDDKKLKEAIRKQMQPASCVLILAGVYATYSKWINIEIELAKSMDKKIIAIEYWGSERTSQVVKDNADIVVKWNTNSIVNAIKELSCKYLNDKLSKSVNELSKAISDLSEAIKKYYP